MTEPKQAPGVRGVTAEAFAGFLAWLDPDRDLAASRYREIHRRLAKTFVCWGCTFPEELADRTLDRVVLKAELIRDGYEGDPFAYILGVARNVRREDARAHARAQRRLTATVDVGARVAMDERLAKERKLACLDRCLAQSLSADERRLLLEYYQQSRQVPGSRRALAGAQGLSATTLRKRTQRYRQRLAACMRRCMDGQDEVTEQEPRP